MAMATVVLVHGAWHGSWTWDHVTPLLTDAGVPWRTITLPTYDGAPAADGSLPGLADDVAAVTALLDDVATAQGSGESDGVVLVGHSYGGMVISSAGHHPAVRRLVYLTAVAPAEGESVMHAVVGPEPVPLGEAIDLGDDGRMLIRPDGAVAAFYADVEPGLAAEAIAALRPVPMSIFDTPAGPPAWHATPTTYVVCEQDGAIAPARQRALAQRATTDIVSWDTSHSPFLSRPALVADLLVRLAAAV